MRATTLIALFLTVASGYSSEQSAPQPGRAWTWTDGQRLTALLDDSAAALRVKTDRERRGRTRLPVGPLSSAGTNAPVDVIDGRRDPHLFFPFELFQQLVMMAYAEDANVRIIFRESKNDARLAAGLPDDIWNRLEGIVASYRAAQLRNANEGRASTTNPKSSADLTAKEFCRERHAALVEAQATFGPGFTQFLYTAVAPDMHRQYMRRPDRTLLAIAKGDCQ